jgi:hypothetical protein
MGDLAQFKHDIFLSYGWSGIASAGEGDREWVAQFKRELTNQVSAELGRAARIYFDVEQSPNGELPENLDEAVQSSVLFLSVISPGSCREGSWCRRELNHFGTSGAPLLPNRRQIFAARVRNIDRSEWPEPLPRIVPYDFLHEEGPRGPLPWQDFADARTPCGRLMQRLAIDMAGVLKEIERQVATTVFFAATSAALSDRVTRLAMEIRRRGGTAIEFKLEPNDTLDSFQRRFERELLTASLSVHLEPAAPAPPPDGWGRGIETLQQMWASRRVALDGAPMIVWRESGARGEPGAVTAPALEGTGFEYLDSALREAFRLTVDSAAASAAVREEIARAAASGRNGNGASAMKYVFVECVQQDLARLEPLRAALRSQGIDVRVPLFQGDEAARRRISGTILTQCHAAAVYFGSLNDLEAYLACQRLSDDIQHQALSMPRAILLDPPNDPIRQYFFFPEFSSYPSSTPEAFAKAVIGEAV